MWVLNCCEEFQNVWLEVLLKCKLVWFRSESVTSKQRVILQKWQNFCKKEKLIFKILKFELLLFLYRPVTFVFSKIFQKFQNTVVALTVGYFLTNFRCDWITFTAEIVTCKLQFTHEIYKIKCWTQKTVIEQSKGFQDLLMRSHRCHQLKYLVDLICIILVIPLAISLSTLSKLFCLVVDSVSKIS